MANLSRVCSTTSDFRWLGIASSKNFTSCSTVSIQMTSPLRSKNKTNSLTHLHVHIIGNSTKSPSDLQKSINYTPSENLSTNSTVIPSTYLSTTFSGTSILHLHAKPYGADLWLTSQRGCHVAHESWCSANPTRLDRWRWDFIPHNCSCWHWKKGYSWN